MNNIDNASQLPNDLQLAYAVGIDFGTTKSGLSFVGIRAQEGGRPEPRGVMLYADGAQFMPSAVYIEEDGTPVVGRNAADRSDHGDYNPERFFTEFKLHLGRDVPQKYKSLDLSPVDLAYLVLRELKLIAETGELRAASPIEQATITVPSSWSEEKKAATKKAALAAGFKSVNLIREPYAALLSINPDERFSQVQRKFVIVDYGGGTCDVAVCERFPGTFLSREPKFIEYTLEDCGGLQIDESLTRYTLELASEELGIDYNDLEQGFERIRRRIEREKIDFVDWLTSNQLRGDNKFTIPNMIDRRKFEFEMTEDAFNDVIKSEVERVGDAINGALGKANVRKEEIDAVLLVGGSSLIPLTSKIVGEILGSEKIINVEKPRHHVSNGAAIWQYYHTTGSSSVYGGITRYSTLSLLGKSNRGVLAKLSSLFGRTPQKYTTKVLVKAGTPIIEARNPRSFEVKTPLPNMTEIVILVVEGEEENPENSALYVETILDFEKAVPQGSFIIVEYYIDPQDMLVLTASLKDGGDSVTIIGHSSINPRDIEQITTRFS